MPARGLAATTVLVVALCCAAPAAAQPSDADTVVVRRGGVELTLGEIDARMEEVPPDRRAGFLDSPERIDSTLSQMLLVEQLAAEAEAASLDKDPRLAAQMEMHRKRLLAGLRLEQLRAAASEKIDATALARERYAADRAKYAEPERRTVRHLLVSTESRGDAEALASIREVQRRLAAGESLEALARELSDDEGSRASGGLIENVTPGRTDPAFEAATFALAAPGAVTAEPVKSAFGYHLIELVEIHPGRVLSYDEVKAQLEAEVLAATVERMVRAHTDNLNSLPIDADPDVVASLRTRYRQSAPDSKPATAESPAPPPR
jgi:parvulin-like peptidyl-prolyl isomerase